MRVRGETNSLTIVEQGRVKEVERRTGIAKVVVTPQRNSLRAACGKVGSVARRLLLKEDERW